MAIDIPEIDLELKSEDIVARRKLKRIWSRSCSRLCIYHSIDAEAELTSMLSEYISLEIDRNLRYDWGGGIDNEKWSKRLVKSGMVQRSK